MLSRKSRCLGKSEYSRIHPSSVPIRYINGGDAVRSYLAAVATSTTLPGAFFFFTRKLVLLQLDETQSSVQRTLKNSTYVYFSARQGCLTPNKNPCLFREILDVLLYRIQ